MMPCNTGFTTTIPDTDKERNDGHFVGTPDYASSAALRGFAQGPRDDLESLAYSLLELWHGG